MHYRITLLLLALLFTISCEKENFEAGTENGIPKSPGTPIDTLHYLALGDSYTIGESVKYSLNFPSQLTEQVNLQFGDSLYIQQPSIIARTGWTAGRLLQEVEQQALLETYDLITLLIGVNNQFQSLPFADFEEDYAALLDFALEKTAGNDNQLLLISIPDYAYTPFGQSNNDTERISTEIDKYNAYIEQQATLRGVPFINITDISREALEHPELLAPDNLHPSGEMYARWVDRLIPTIFR